MNTVYLYGEFGWEVTARNVREQLNSLDLDASNELEVKIFSPGGDVREGFAIKNILVGTGKQLTTIAEGLVGSIATIPFLAGSRRVMMENTEFFIHHPSGGTYGTVEDLEAFLQVLKDKRTEILDYYQNRSGQSIESLSEWMDNETSFTPSEALELGFATEIITETVQARQMRQIFNNKNMNESKFIDRMVAKMEAVLKPVKALKLSTAAGDVFDIATNENDAKVGDTVNLKGQSVEDGTYEMQDGRKFTINAGAIAEIEEAPELIGLDAVQNMVDKMTDKMTAFFSEKLEAKDTEIENLKEELKNVKSQISSNYQPPRADQHGDDTPEGEKMITREDLRGNSFEAKVQAAINKQ